MNSPEGNSPQLGDRVLDSNDREASSPNAQQNGNEQNVQAKEGGKPIKKVSSLLMASKDAFNEKIVISKQFGLTGFQCKFLHALMCSYC